MAVYYGDPLQEPTRTIADNGFNKLLTKENLSAAPPPDFQHQFTGTPGAIAMSSQEMGGSISFGHQFITVQPGQDIQVALDRVKAAGGGIVRLLTERYRVRDKDIIVPANVTLQGEGRDNTVLDFVGTGYKLRIKGTSTNTVLHARIKDLSLLGSTGDGVDIQFSQGAYIQNVISNGHDGYGFRVHSSAFATFTDCIADGNGLANFRIDNDSGSSTQAHIYFNNCISQNGLSDGFSIVTATGAVVADLYFFGCRANLNEGNGYFTSGGLDIHTAFVGCFSGSNVGDGYDITTENTTFVACTAESNDTDGFENKDFDNKYIGCRAQGNTGDDWDLQIRATVVGNNFVFSTTTDPTSNFSAASLNIASDLVGNIGAGQSTAKKIRYMNNSAGADRAAGRPVIYKNTTNTRGDEGDDPDENGDDRACGMWAEFTTNAEWGAVLMEGYTTDLKVAGTTDVAIGDLLSMQVTGPVWRKALDGDTANAIALEAYTTNDNSGVIDAILIPPRKVGSTVPAQVGSAALSSNSSVNTGGTYQEAGDGDDEVTLTTTVECKFHVTATRCIQPNSDTGRTFQLKTQIDTVDIAGSTIDAHIGGMTTSSDHRMPITSVAVTDAKAAGTYVFRVMQNSDSGRTVSFTSGNLVVIALPTGN